MSQFLPNSDIERSDENWQRNKQINEVYELIINIASGKLNTRGVIYGVDEELDAITAGINMLAEELQKSTVSHAYLKRFYGSMPDMIVLVDTQYKILEVNPALISILKVEADEVKGQHISAILHEKIRYRNLEELNILLPHLKETRFRTSDGLEIHVSVSWAPLYDDDRHIDGFLLVAKDIGEMLRTQRSLAVKNSELNSFIYRASHDLNGPITSIKGILQLAEDECSQTTPQLLELFGYVGQSVEKLGSIINDFLELGRVTHGLEQYEEIDWEGVLTGISAKLASKANANDVKIYTTVRADTPFKSRKMMIKVIIENLIDNAITYYDPTKENSFVNISIEVEEDNATITVTDNSTGMNERVLPKIFNMFYRGSSSAPGSGLGLYVVKSSVEALSGAISCESREGEGTTTKIILPPARVN